MRYHDISLPLRDGLAGWPGDPPVIIAREASIQSGDPFAVSRLVMGSHTGTHVDAPAHALADGRSVDGLPLEALCGPALLREVPERPLVTAADLEALGLPPDCRRLLLKTRNSAEGLLHAPAFRRDYTALDAGAARWIAERGLALVGIDALSIEPYAEEMGPVHRALLAADVVVLEGLDLAGVAPGAYELLCLPLRIAGGDGAPARAVLREA